MTDYLAYSYAVAVTVGGFVGYIKKGSIMSGVMVSTLSDSHLLFNKLNDIYNRWKHCVILHNVIRIIFCRALCLEV